MRIDQFLGTTAVLVLTLTTTGLAGGLAGGGGPPSKQFLEQILQKHSGRAALFAWDDHHLGLGVDQPLLPEMELTHKAPQCSGAIAMATADFSKLAAYHRLIIAINRDAQIRFYRVLDGEQEGTLLLKDRRVIMRASLRLKL